MSEILTIKNFGPIKDMSFEFKKINIFVGDQGTGKSTVAKLFYVIKEVLNFGDSNNPEHKTDWNMIHFHEQLENTGIKNYLKPNTYIEYKHSFKYLKFAENKILIEENNEKYKVNDTHKNKNTDIAEYIPSYREAAVLLKDSLNAIAAAGASLPKLFYLFGQRLINAKKSKRVYNYTDVLNVKYRYSDDEDIIIMKDGKEIPIGESSSAVNSGIPMLLAFDYVVDSMQPKQTAANAFRTYTKANRPFVIIEEPELNCFPETQNKLMKYFVSKSKYTVKEQVDFFCGLVLTTHSPYILTSLNNLMYAYLVGQKEPVETDKIINKKYWVNPDEVSAYMLLPDGTYEDIVDKGEGLIKAEKIDSVSRILNSIFEKLSNLEFAKT